MLAKLSLKPNTKRAYLSTKCNGQTCGIESRNKIVGDESNYYQMGIEIRISGDGNYVFDTWTVYESRHVMNSHLVVDFRGVLCNNDSKVNCFSLGWMSADQEYVDELIKEVSTMLEKGKRVWETVE
jgi:hypothetical protein